MVTLKDIAQASGVTISTVSIILNSPEKSSRFKKETIEHVRKVADRMNYSPNHRARIFRGGLTRSIGIALEGSRSSDLITQPYWSRLISGLHSALQNNDYQLVLISSVENKTATSTAFRYLQERRVDALAMTEVPSQEDLPLLHAATAPYLLLGRAEFSGFPSIYVDDQAGVRLALDRLRSLGHKEVLWLGPLDWYDYSAERRSSLFAVHCMENGLDGRICRFDYKRPMSGVETPGLFTQAKDALHDYLKTSPKPSAILCYNGDCAVGAYRALKAARYSIPEDCSVIGFDSHQGLYLEPALTTINLKRIEMGEVAANCLLQALRDEPKKPLQNNFCKVLQPEITQTDSIRQL